MPNQENSIFDCAKSKISSVQFTWLKLTGDSIQL